MLSLAPSEVRPSSLTYFTRHSPLHSSSAGSFPSSTTINSELSYDCRRKQRIACLRKPVRCPVARMQETNSFIGLAFHVKYDIRSHQPSDSVGAMGAP